MWLAWEKRFGQVRVEWVRSRLVRSHNATHGCQLPWRRKEKYFPLPSEWLSQHVPFRDIYCELQLALWQQTTPLLNLLRFRRPLSNIIVFSVGQYSVWNIQLGQNVTIISVQSKNYSKWNVMGGNHRLFLTFLTWGENRDLCVLET